MRIFCFVLLSIFTLCKASPKKYSPDEGNRYFESNLPSVKNSSKLEEKEGRFGIPIYTTTGNGVQYGSNTGTGYVYNPVKIDVGGIAIGALIGLGAILLVPKLASVFGGGHYRSLETDISSVTDILSKIDNTLEENHIDSSTCMQRIICSYVNQAQKNMVKGEASAVDQFIYSLANNALFTYMVDGTAVKEAVEMGRRGEDEKCAGLYSMCPISKENLTKVIASLLP